MTTTELETFFGTPNKAADFFGVSPEAFYQWRKRPGSLIPKGRAAEAAYRTNGQLVFRPELYQRLQIQLLESNYKRKINMVEPNLKEAVKAMCKAYPGGREAMAGALGMTVTQFNNNLYEKNGCRFFEVSELEAMEDISNTSLLADYFARRRGALLVDVPHLEELDRVDLFSRAMRTSAARGQVDQIIEQALEDGVIERHEAEEIMVHHRRHLAAREEEIAAIITLFSRKKK